LGVNNFYIYGDGKALQLAQTGQGLKKGQSISASLRSSKKKKRRRQKAVP